MYFTNWRCRECFLGVLIKYLRFDSDNCLIWLEEGDVLFDAGKFDDAINFYDKALEKDLGNIDALEGIADAFRELGKLQRSIGVLMMKLWILTMKMQSYGLIGEKY